MKLELDLTPEQYQQLLECFFTGAVILEDYYYPDFQANLELSSKINSQAKKFGKEDLVFTNQLRWIS
jgi:hypothetical protein